VNIDGIFGIHGAALVARGRRAEVLAANLANADTPNYKARDVDFAELMRAQVSGTESGAALLKTDARHMDVGSEIFPGAELMYRTPKQPSLDGNTVDTQTEQAEFMKNSLQYQTSLQFLNKRIEGLRLAIKGE
jgi:flagellar basal-body rod protein FlgB